MTAPVTTLPLLPDFPTHLEQRGRDVEETWVEMRGVIEHAITNQPRSLQTRIGPSEVGTDCTRCLARKLAGVPELRDAAWLPWIGTAVHGQLEDTFIDANTRWRPEGLNATRWLLETRVHVGDIDGQPITGSSDCYDRVTAGVWDWKIVGATTLKKAKAKGASPTYRAQAHLYGRGFVARGVPVDYVAIAYLPRNSVSLADAYVWHEPYDEAIALAALARANELAANVRLLQQLGADLHAYFATLPVAEDCFSCNRYPNPDGSRPLAPGHNPDPITALIA